MAHMIDLGKQILRHENVAAIVVGPARLDAMSELPVVQITTGQVAILLNNGLPAIYLDGEQARAVIDALEKRTDDASLSRWIS